MTCTGLCVCVTCVRVSAGVHAQVGMCVHLYLEGRGHRSASSSIARYITLFLPGVSHLVWSLKIWLAKLARKSPGPPVSLLPHPHPRSPQWLCCTVWWVLTKAYEWRIPIPVWDEAMPVPPGNSCKHSIANPISAAAKGRSGLCYYSLAASRMFCGKGYYGSPAGCWLLAVGRFAWRASFQSPHNLDVSGVQSFQFLRGIPLHIAHFVYAFSRWLTSRLGSFQLSAAWLKFSEHSCTNLCFDNCFHFPWVNA